MFYDWSYKGSTYSAVVPLTNLFGLYQIPEPEPEPGQLTPINLVFQWCLIFDTKLKNFITCYLTWNIDTNLGWFVRNEHEHDQLILVDPVEEDVEEFVHGLILQTSYNAI